MTTYPQKATSAAHKTKNSFLSFEFKDKIRPPIIRFGQICLLNVSFSLSSHLHPHFLRQLPPHLSPRLVTGPPIHAADGGQLFLKWLVTCHLTTLKTITGSASFTRWSGNGLDEGTILGRWAEVPGGCYSSKADVLGTAWWGPSYHRAPDGDA